jgi:cysteine-rich repeat protein
MCICHILIHTPVPAPSGRPGQKHTNTNKQICGDGVSSGIESQTAGFCDDGNVVGGDGCSNICSVECGFGCIRGPEILLKGV